MLPVNRCGSGSDDSHFYEFLEYRFTDWFLRVKAPDRDGAR